MKQLFIGLTALVVALGVTGAAAAPLQLKPASPQPGSLRSGLAVTYAYEDWQTTGKQVDNIAEARHYLKTVPESGKPLKGLDHWETNKGDLVMTSRAWFNLAAQIQGYIRINEPGEYTIDFLTNDGIDARIGGQKVGQWPSNTQGCESTSAVDVVVPKAGWYPVSITYFQKAGTACLHMRMAKKGQKLKVVSDSAFGY
jgi:PA14 domain-containing protein